jgi:hypothetical protein
MALSVVSDYLTRARSMLLDLTVPYRYSDTDLTFYLDEGILESRRQRPDLWLSTFRGALPQYSGQPVATAVIIDQQYQLAFVYYMVGRAIIIDQEDTEDPRAAGFMNKFNTTLNGGGP